MRQQYWNVAHSEVSLSPRSSEQSLRVRTTSAGEIRGFVSENVHDFVTGCMIPKLTLIEAYRQACEGLLAGGDHTLDARRNLTENPGDLELVILQTQLRESVGENVYNALWESGDTELSAWWP